MEITTAMIKELREKTGAGILDCKSALGEANGSIEEAEKILRKKGLAAAAKKAGRVAAEGLVGYHKGAAVAALVERPWTLAMPSPAVWGATTARIRASSAGSFFRRSVAPHLHVVGDPGGDRQDRPRSPGIPVGWFWHPAR